MLSLLFAALVSNPYPIELISCYDGDTCTVNVILETKTERLGLDVEVVTLVKLKDQKIRLCNIQAPEIRPLATREAATESRDALLSLLGSARSLSVKTWKRDSFGRILVLLYADGVEVNQKMIDLEYATPYTPSCKFE
jgi:endonuclease YncB( thermonuclease family)